MKPVIIGTAGHIDHGKTALVKALTGTNTDRLKEEKARGITIELGYAFLNENIAIIDVPGHEKFIKHMVAGAATVDFACLVVAADDGIMPQTREHFDILRLLGIEDGIVVITKCALAEDDWIDLVAEEIAEMTQSSFLENRPIIKVDSLSGDGIDEAKQELIKLADKKTEKPPGAVFRLPIDRVFSIKGFGTVVTGSSLSGSVKIEDKLELLPKGKVVRVRGIETQGQLEKAATSGMRLAINIPGLSVKDISRGDILATPNRLKPTFMLDVECRILQNSPIALEQRQRVRVHLGTKEVMARIVILDKDRIEPGENGLVQLRLEELTAAQRLDRYVIRRYSPQLTIGGGRILDANPTKHRKRHASEIVDSLKELGEAKEEQVILRILGKEKVLTFESLVTKSNLESEKVEDLIGGLGINGQIIELEAKGNRHLCGQLLYITFNGELREILTKYHQKHPLRVGAKRGEILTRWKKDLPDFLLKHFVDLAIADLSIKSPGGDLLALHSFSILLTKKQRGFIALMSKEIEKGGFQPPDIASLALDIMQPEKATKQLMQVLVDQEIAINLEGKIYFHKDAVEAGKLLLQKSFKETPEMTMSQFRILIGTSRKFAMPLLNYFDSMGYTTRTNDVRVSGSKLYAENS